VKVAGAHLTYCTNIHPGETWDEIRANLERYLPLVKEQASPDAPFGVGLRLSAVAARSLSEPGPLADFKAFLAAQGLYVFTINGFPYGPFHGTRVKDDVYRPDWRDPARLDYTNLLADLLAQLLPPGLDCPGSISTVPGAFKAHATDPEAVPLIVEQLLRHAAHLVSLERATGRCIVLALEPEPCCLLETVDETVRFFRQHLHSGAAAARLAALTGLDVAAAATALRRHLGVCLDLCHAAVEFEDPAACVQALERAGITIAKVQVTAGLRIPQVTAAVLDELRRYEDAVYLHQVVEHAPTGLQRYADLVDARTAGHWRDGTCEWRVHFHVPVFLEALEPFASTQSFVREVLAQQRQQAFATQLEVETYTWSVLPPQHRTANVEDAIARELAWVRGCLA
jgi:sugar phosphate isomerase/epimerase